MQTQKLDSVLHRVRLALMDLAAWENFRDSSWEKNPDLKNPAEFIEFLENNKKQLILDLDKFASIKDPKERSKYGYKPAFTVSAIRDIGFCQNKVMELMENVS